MRDVVGGNGHANGLLQKIILGIASALCILLLGVLMTDMQHRTEYERQTAERIARLETKVDMLLMRQPSQ